MGAKQFARRPNRSVAREMYQTRHGGRDLNLCPYGTTPLSCTNADCADGECLSRSAQCSLSVPSDKHDDGAARQQETMLTVELAGPISAEESSRLSSSTEADRRHSGNEGKAPGTFSQDRIKPFHKPSSVGCSTPHINGFHYIRNGMVRHRHHSAVDAEPIKKTANQKEFNISLNEDIPDGSPGECYTA